MVLKDTDREDFRLLQMRRDNIIAALVAVIFILSSIAIFATKYRDDFMGWNKDEQEVATDGDALKATPDDSSKSDTEQESESTEELTTEEISTESTVSEEPSTEEPVTEEPTTEDVRQYVDVDTPDLSSKGDDWYNEEIYTPGNAIDDKYFDTALLIGDSRTEGLALYTGLSNLDAFYSKGLNIEKVMTEPVVTSEDGTMITVLEALEQKNYENIYISFGLNELGWAYDYLFIDDYKTFIDAVRQAEPDATIYVESILPVSAELSAEDEIYNNPKIISYNQLLKEMCQDYGDVIYLDVASSVTVDGALPADASTDGRHCNKDYCLMWLDYIRQNVYIK